VALCWAAVAGSEARPPFVPAICPPTIKPLQTRTCRAKADNYFDFFSLLAVSLP
jgi:hypothetical protein